MKSDITEYLIRSYCQKGSLMCYPFPIARPTCLLSPTWSISCITDGSAGPSRQLYNYGYLLQLQ